MTGLQSGNSLNPNPHDFDLGFEEEEQQFDQQGTEVLPESVSFSFPSPLIPDES